jgi:hypothetical protein
MKNENLHLKSLFEDYQQDINIKEKFFLIKVKKLIIFGIVAFE